MSAILPWIYTGQTSRDMCNCYSHQRSILQCWKQKEILFSLSSESWWHCAQQFLLTWKPTERHCWSFLVSKDSNNVIFLEGLNNALSIEITQCSNLYPSWNNSVSLNSINSVTVFKDYFLSLLQNLIVCKESIHEHPQHRHDGTLNWKWMYKKKGCLKWNDLEYYFPISLL